MMRILLDTQVFLLYILGSGRIPTRYIHAIRHPANEVFLSVVSQWEIAVKHQIGKLDLPTSPRHFVPQQRRLHAIESFPLDEPSVEQLSELPILHRDPFDRMLICQALAHDLIFASLDRLIERYPVKKL